MNPWLEIGPNVFVRRYAFLDQTIGAIVGDDGVLLIDTRSSIGQAAELRRDVAALTPRPVTGIVNTHMHWDHAWGNAEFEGLPIWGHVRCREALLAWTPATLAAEAAEIEADFPDAAGIFEDLRLVPPDRTFEESLELAWGDRHLTLRHLGRGHTDNDVAILVPPSRPDAGDGVLFAGDLLENGAAPSFGDSYPLDWPATLDRFAPLATGAVVPGHGEVADREFLLRQREELGAVAELGRRVLAGELAADDAARRGPYPPDVMVEAFGRIGA